LLKIRGSIQFAEGAGMEILISKMATKDGEQWSVKAGTIALTFKDQASACCGQQILDTGLGLSGQ
jgi:hypothetical protein